MHIQTGLLNFPSFLQDGVRVDPVLLVGASRVESGVFLVSARVRSSAVTLVATTLLA